jgi:glycerol-3-phosphate dehydrogenase
MSLHEFDRSRALARLAGEHFDVVVVGGGITGAGVALDAASRGLRVGLVEQGDLASGTSSKSSKLVHGGLRYLQQGEFGLVYEALAERQIALRNAPHLVRQLPFLIPMFTRDGLLNPRLSRALGLAMWQYDLTGGLRIGRVHRRLSKKEALTHIPTLDRDRLASSYLYFDARVDDARYTLAIARTAACDLGAAVATGCRVVNLVSDAYGRVQGATVEADGDRFDIRASAVVNATGVWTDRVDALQSTGAAVAIRPAKGVHITLPRSVIGTDIAVVLPVPGDKRSIFVIPWGDVTYVGTTDTDYTGPLEDPPCTSADVDYLLAALNAALGHRVQRSDVVGTWSGLRPLVAGDAGRTADLSRRHTVVTSPSGLVTVTGGKLTTWRKMAADTVEALLPRLGKRRRCRTKRLALRGKEGWTRVGGPDVDAATAEHLAGRFGGEARAVLALVHQRPDLAGPLVPGLPYLRAEAVFSARFEQVTTLDDVLSRRTRARILGRDASAAAAGAVAELLAPELGWDARRTAAEVSAYTESIRRERDAAQLPETPLELYVGA